MNLENMLFMIYTAIFIHLIATALFFNEIRKILISLEALQAVTLRAYMEVNKITNIEGTYKSGDIWKKKGLI